MSDDLSAFLTARLDEDQAQAQDAIAERGRIKYAQPLPDGFQDFDLQAWDDADIPAVLVGPERVLADVESKRRIVALHPVSDGHCCVDPDDVQLGEVVYWGEPCETLKALLPPYADHHDFRQEWRL